MKRSQQRTQEQRYQIYGLLKARFNQTGIANEIGVDKSTVCRELNSSVTEGNEDSARSRFKRCEIDVIGHATTPKDLIPDFPLDLSKERRRA